MVSGGHAHNLSSAGRRHKPWRTRAARDGGYAGSQPGICMKLGSVAESVFAKIDFIHLWGGDISLQIGDFSTKNTFKTLVLNHKYEFWKLCLIGNTPFDCVIDDIIRLSLSWIVA
ncbi:MULTISPECIES: hypothetical protein [unclassified Sphingobium]|uniref:hypothetical protein n=1 Tax=unclassified Sphingobium TaxID=2611147 RepID=UPI00222577F5|nr:MULTISPECIES: hypothetical protein [unclassified Sphingobium]MCW2396890.1 hypothetical protein [Sphingobium sp. B8D3B]MCW2417096.1 hypothetical protein [Sphingobium sp. B8D3C]